MKNRWLDINGESIRNTLRQLLSPAFLLILLGSFLLWLATGLSHDYTTEMPLNLRVEGQKYRLTAIVNGRGSVILAQRLSLKSKLTFTPQELSAGSSGEASQANEITFASIGQAINSKITGLVVIQVLDAPGLVPEQVLSSFGADNNSYAHNQFSGLSCSVVSFNRSDSSRK